MAEEKFDYFIEQTNQRLSNMDDKLDQLISFRMMLIGGAFAVSAVSSIVMNLLFLFVHGK